MSEDDTIEAGNEELTAAVKNGREVLGAARDTLARFLTGEYFPFIAHGQTTAKRKGSKRPVVYLEVEDEAGNRFRIEAFSLKKHESEEVVDEVVEEPTAGFHGSGGK